MAASVIANDLFCWGENNKSQDEMKLSTLMERLRAKHSNQSSLLSAKGQRLPSFDKKWTAEDILAFHQHQETLLKSIKAVGHSHIVDRLESIARQAKLRFQADSSKESVCLSSDEFFVQLFLDSKGNFVNAQISSNTEAKECPSLVRSLNDVNFDELKQHLEGLQMLYCIDGDRSTKCKAAQALLSLESDLNTLSNLQRSISSVQSYIHKSPLGVVSSRNGGLPMKLTFFVGPYDLLNYHNKTMTPMTLEAIIDQRVGFSVTVGIEPSHTNRVQIHPLMTINKLSDGKSGPPASTFCPLTNQNSAQLPMQFILRLHRPVILSKSVVSRIQKMTGIETAAPKEFQPLVALLMEQITRGKVKAKHWNKQSTVNLPDQMQQYYFGGDPDLLQGVLVSKVPFIHPTNVPLIIAYLRQQVLFNTVIQSCLRRKRSHGVSTGLLFEVTPLSLQQVSITFEHKSSCSLITAELDLSDLMAVGCKLLSCPDSLCTTSHATMVFQRCLSLPVTLRAILSRSSAAQQSYAPVPSLYQLLPLEVVRDLQQRKQRDARRKKVDPHAAIKLSAPLFIANNCIPLARGRQATRHNHVLVGLSKPPGFASLNALGVKALTLSSHSCWGASTSGDEVENRLKHLSENLVPICSPKLNLPEVELLSGNAMMSGLTSSHAALASVSNTAMSSTPAFCFSPSVLTKRDVITMPNALLTKDFGTSSHSWPVVSKSSPTGVLLPNVNRPLSKITKEQKQVVVSCLPTTSLPESAMLSMQPARQPKRLSVHENYMPGSVDSSLQDSQKIALLKRPRASAVANPELVSILSEPLPGEGPPVKRVHLEKHESVVGMLSEPSPSRQGPAAISSNQLAGNGKAHDGTTKPLSKSSSASVNDVEDLVRLEEQLQQVTQSSQNASIARQDSNSSSNGGLTKDFDVKTENCSPDFYQPSGLQPGAGQKSVLDEKPAIIQKETTDQKPALDQMPSLDQKPSFDQNPVLDQKSESPATAVFEFSKGISNKANNDAKSDLYVKVEGIDSEEKPSAPLKLPSTKTDEDKPPIKVILNKRTLQQGCQGENLYQMNDHSFWKEKPRDRKPTHSVKSSPLMPEYVVDLSPDTEVDSLTCGGLVTAGLKVAAGRSSTSPQVSKVDRKDGVRPAKRPKTSKTSTEPGEKRGKREDGKKSSKKKKVSDDDDDSIADDASSTSSSIHPMERITTIKITNSGGKLQIQNPVKEVSAMNVTGGKSPTIVMRNSVTPSPITAAPKINRPSPSAVTSVPTKLNRPAILTSRMPNRSKSESGGGTTASGGTDLKLNKTPTVKLKQLAVVTSRPGVVGPGTMAPHVAKGSTQLNKVGGFSSGLVVAPGNRSRANPSIDSKLARKGSLSSVIDTLMKKQHSGSSSQGSNREGHVVSQKKILDAIRIQIIREGNKPSAPPRELAANTIKSSSSIAQTTMRKSDAGKLDPVKAMEIANRVVQTTQAPLPKLSMPSKVMPNGMTTKTSISLGPVTSVASYRSMAPSLIEKPQVLDSPAFITKSSREPVSAVATMDTVRPYELPLTTCKPSYVSGMPTTPSAAMPLGVLSPQIMRPMCDVSRMRPPFLPALPPPSLPFVPPTNVNLNIRMMPTGNSGGLRGPAIPVTSPFCGKPAAQAGSPVPGYSSKLNEISDRLARRHFTDVVTPGSVDESGGGHERCFSPPRSPSPVDDSKQGADDMKDGAFLGQDGLPKVIDFFADDMTVAGNPGDSGGAAKEPNTSDSIAGPFRIPNHLVKSSKPAVDPGTDVSVITENSKQTQSHVNAAKEPKDECSTSKNDNSFDPLTSASEDKEKTVWEIPMAAVSPRCSPKPTESQQNLVGGKVDPLHPGGAEIRPAPSPVVLESSSPGDGLLIDYPSSPKAMLQNAQPNEMTPESPSEQAKSSADIIILSPSPQKQSPPAWCSAIKSPTILQNSQSSPTFSNSACNSDDDLMDVALTL